MRPSMMMQCCMLGFLGGLAALVPAFGQAGRAAIPAHPRDIQYRPLQYTPPQASAYRQVLNNGVQGFFVEDHDLPLITVTVLIRTGAYLEPADKEGLASAVGSQLRSGGTARYAARQFDEEVDFLAAEISSSIGATAGRASANFMAKDTERALELFFEMLRAPAFQQDQLDLYKGQQLQAMARRNDSTEDIESREWNRLLRGDKHFSNAFSTQRSIDSLTREDLTAFHAKYYHPANLILSVSGDFQTAAMKERLEKAMAGWVSPGGAVPPVPRPDYAPVPGVYMVHKPEVNQARVSLGHLGIMRGHPDEIALDLMNDILGGGGFTSRIMNKVRTEEGLAYDAGSSYAAGIYYAGQFRAGFQSKSATAAQAAQIVLDEMARMRQEKVTQDELDTVKNQAIEIFPRLFASAMAIADTFASDAYTGRDPQFWETYRDRVKAVTAEDIQRVAREHLHPEKLTILVVGNTDEVLKGNPDTPSFAFQKISGGKIHRIPLPDPLTMMYPK